VAAAAKDKPRSDIDDAKRPVCDLAIYDLGSVLPK
jgi:hypothetical protein